MMTKNIKSAYLICERNSIFLRKASYNFWMISNRPQCGLSYALQLALLLYSYHLVPGPVEARRYIVALLAMLQNAGKPLPSADMLGWKGSEAFPRSPCLAKADWRLAIDAQTNSGRFLLSFPLHVLKLSNKYRNSANSFRRNYSFLKVENV